MKFDAWLDRATAADLSALALCLRDGRIPFPPRAGAVALAGFDEGATRLLEGLKTTESHVVAWMLERWAAERRRADDRQANLVRVVWSGASEASQGLRDTREVLEELFAKAERHVLISTYVIYQGRSVFSTLAKRMRERPELDVEIFVNLPSSSGQTGDERGDTRAYRAMFVKEHWPERSPLPSLYYDPESRKGGASRSSLHAKCVVVDMRWSLVTSANFTEAAQERNIEAGVLLDHVPVAESLVGQFRALRETGRLQPME